MARRIQSPCYVPPPLIRYFILKNQVSSKSCKESTKLVPRFRYAYAYFISQISRGLGSVKEH